MAKTVAVPVMVPVAVAVAVAVAVTVPVGRTEAVPDEIGTVRPITAGIIAIRAAAYFIVDVLKINDCRGSLV